MLGDASELAGRLGRFDLAYIDPPYNQHRYFTNYHIWETLTAWDAPEHYGVACKRVDARDAGTKSVFNERRRMPDALARVIADVDARLVVISYNDEAWVTIEDLEEMAAARGGAVRTLAFDSKRYVGAQIGIHNPRGEKVGTVARLRNVEYVVLCGEPELVERASGAEGCTSRAMSRSSPEPRRASARRPPRRLHAAGAEVVVADLNDERGAAVAAELGSRSEYVRCDVTSPSRRRRGDRARDEHAAGSRSRSTAPVAASPRAPSRATAHPTTSMPFAASSSSI